MGSSLQLQSHQPQKHLPKQGLLRLPGEGYQSFYRDTEAKADCRVSAYVMPRGAEDEGLAAKYQRPGKSTKGPCILAQE